MNFSAIRPTAFAALAAATATVAVLAAPQAQAGFIDLVPAATPYTVLYEGTGGHNLQIANVTINGNIGVGGTGVVQFNGPGTITGRVDFSAANTGQFNNNNGMNVGPTSTNFNVAGVTTALTQINSLSSTLGGETGTSIAISGNQTINGNLGTPDGNGNVVFSVTSYSENDGNLVTITAPTGALAGRSVVLNFPAGNENLKGDVALTGLTDDQVLWNFSSAGNINLSTNDSSFPPPLAFHGVILAPLGVMSMNAATLDGRFWGGDSSDMQIVSHNTINGPVPVSLIPEPGSLAMLGAALVGLGFIRRRRKSGLTHHRAIQFKGLLAVEQFFSATHGAGRRQACCHGRAKTGQ
jgi:hypothetical protein